MNYHKLMVRSLVLFAYIYGSHEIEETTITPHSVEAVENTNVTLSCSYYGDYASYLSRGSFVWILNTTEPRSYQTAVSNSDCFVPDGWLKNSLLYSYTCVNYSRHSVTLVNITQQRHGEMMACKVALPRLETLLSNMVTMRVAVSVKSATVNPVISVLTIAENETPSLICKSSPCRPIPKFRWYIANDNQTDESATILTESEQSESQTDVIRDYSIQLRIPLNRTINGWFLFCGANNSDRGFVLSEKILINVTYPPTLNIVGDATLVEGDSLDKLCNFTDGNPRVTKITWSWQGVTWNVDPLRPNMVTRNQTGLYRCTVQNVMVFSDGTQVVGIASGPLTLTVQYKAAVVRLAINETNNVTITVNENDAVNITCDIEGLPLPTGQLLHHSLLNQKLEELPRYTTFQTTTNIRLNSVFQAQCTDNGILICTGTNTFYNGLQSMSNKTVFLFVICKPRKSPYITIPDMVLSSTSVDVILSFTALAYPVPPKSGYVWTRKVKTSDTWINITASGRNTIISTSGLQSNLTIKDVSQFDYGLYRVSIYNDAGHFSHIFNLSSPVYINADTSSTSHTVGVAAGTVGGVVVLVTVTITIIVYKRRKALSKKNEETPSQYYNLDATKGDDNTPVDGGNSNVYEGLHKTGLDQQYDALSPPGCEKETADRPSSNFYEGLQNKGLDQQYDTLSSSASKSERGNNKVYENLRTADRQQVGGSSGSMSYM